jgi:hypothetical protein
MNRINTKIMICECKNKKAWTGELHEFTKRKLGKEVAYRAYKLTCKECNKFICWMNKSEFDAMIANTPGVRVYHDRIVNKRRLKEIEND